MSKQRTLQGFNTSNPDIPFSNMYLPLAEGYANSSIGVITPQALGSKSVSGALTLSGTLTTEWTDRAGWYTGQGDANAFLSATGSADAVTLFPENGHLLIWGVVNCSSLITNNTSVFLEISEATGACVFRVAYDKTNRKIRLQYRSTTSSGINTSSIGAAITDDKDHFFALEIKWKSDASAIQIWNAEKSTGLVKSITPINWTTGVTGVPDVHNFASSIVLGVDSTNTAVATENKVRRLGVIQYGSEANRPSNLDDAVAELYVRSGIPGKLLESI